MYFEFVKDLTIPEKSCPFKQASNLYDNCCNAERDARTVPDSAMASIRQALEVLMSELLNADGQDTTGLDLYNMINCYDEGCSFIRNKRVSDLHDIQEETDKYAESNNKPGYHSTCENACSYVGKLYSAIADIFEQEVEEFEWRKLPIGDYEIVELCPARPYEAVDGDYDYIGEESNSALGRYAYIRPYFNKNNEDQITSPGDIEAQSFFENMPESPLILKGFEIPAMDYCEWKYLAYSINKDTKRLEDIADQLSPEDLLDIVIQIAEGLADLINYDAADVCFFHGSITPTCIFINSYNGKYEAKLACFETAKIDYFDIPLETVQPFMLEEQRGNRFIHSELIDGKEFTKDDRAAGDVFSLAAVLLYCLDRDAVLTCTMDCCALDDYFGTEFAEEMEKILCSGSLETVPTMAGFLDLLRHEKEISSVSN